MERFFTLTDKQFSGFWKCAGRFKYDRSGNIVTLGKTLSLSHDFYPGEALAELELEARFQPEESGGIMLELPPYFINIDTASSYHDSSVSRTSFVDIVCRTDQLVIQKNKVNRLKVRYAAGKVAVKLNGKVLFFKSKYQPTVDRINIFWPPRCVISKLDFSGKKAPDSQKPIRAKQYSYHMAVDFPDDIVPAPFSKKNLALMIKKIAGLGIKRIYWVYYGGRKSGFWDHTGNAFLPDKHIDRTFASLGEDDLKVAVESGHKAGLEVYAIIKPFDLSIMGHNFPPGSRFGKYEVLGGKAYGSFNFVAENTNLCLQRRPFTEVKGPIGKIVLSRKNEAPTRVKDIRVWTSRDNGKYQPYKKPFSFREESGRIVLDGLEIAEKFVALQTLFQDDRGDFVNTLDQLIKVYNTSGKMMAFTYGLTPRKYPKYKNNITELSTHLNPEIPDFSQDGFFFDYLTVGIPSAVMCGDSPLNRCFALDNPSGVLGIAVGKNKFVPGVLCPSEPEARNFWLDLVNSALNFGVDGIDIRRMHHANILEWKEYGFNEPVVKEFKKRYGVDVCREDFNMEQWRKLRGEYFTQFLREVKAVTNSRGRKLQIHIEDQMEGTPDSSTLMEIHWNWEKWLRENIPDEVTFKVLDMQNFRTHLVKKVIRLCQKKNIPVYYSPFIWSVREDKNWKNYLSSQVRNCGVSGFVVYEAAPLIVSQKNGNLKNHDLSLTKYLQKLALKEMC